MFTGVFVATITPFKNGKVDQDSLRKHVNWLIKNGVDGLVPCGTTGEAATLNNSEYSEVVRIVVEETSKRVPIIAGAGANSTSKAIELAKLVIESGADATLQVTPYYNKPTQEGLYQHYKTIANEVRAPHILYNVPGRTAVNLSSETAIKLSKIDNIVGLKEASGDLHQIEEILENVSKDFSVLSGNDDQNLDIYFLGGKGAISVTANIIPDKVSQVWKYYRAGSNSDANKLQEELEDLNEIMFIETNPIPVKTSLSLMNRCSEEFRLPLTSLKDENKEQLKVHLKKYNLI